METHQYGGIIGKTWINNYIQGCYNSGNISGKDYIGGIVGHMSSSGEYISQTTNCYNSGIISSDRVVGGIVGSVSGDNSSILFCYNIGNIGGKTSYSIRGSIVGSKDGIIQNCYYSNTSEIKAIQNEDDEANNVYGLADEYMKSEEFVNLLNLGSEDTIWKIGNDYYPYAMLNWQEYITILKGDVSGDSIIDFMDILQINKHRLGKALLTGIQLEAAEVTGDGIIDFMDILQINKYRLGKIDSL